MEFESCYVVDSFKSILKLRMALLDSNSDFGKSLGKKLRSSNSSYMAKFLFFRTCTIFEGLGI